MAPDWARVRSPKHPAQARRRYRSNRDFQAASRPTSGCGIEWQKKFTLSGRPVRWRITPISACALAGVSRAQGNEPSPPASLTAMAIAASVAPAIGAWTIGRSIPSRSSNRRSGHIALSRISCAGHRAVRRNVHTASPQGLRAHHRIGCRAAGALEMPHPLACLRRRYACGRGVGQARSMRDGRRRV